MAITLSSFQEMTGDGSGSPSTAGFSIRSAKAISKYFVPAGVPNGINNAGDLQAAVTLLLGSTDLGIGDGRMSRTLPAAHPVFPWLIVSNISSIQGVGTGTLTSAAAELTVPPIPQYYLWNGPVDEPNSGYIFTLEFSQVPFAVLPNNAITVKATQWTDIESEPSYPNGEPVTSQLTTEYLRFTDVTILSKEEAITAQLGSMVFRTATGGLPGGAPPVSFSGMPKITLPNQLLVVKTYGMPFRYLASPNSYISKFPIRVNQLPFAIGYQTYAPGQLLYLGYTPVKYTPPVQAEEEEAPGVYSTEFVMDIEFTFSLTSRVVSDPPTPAMLNNKNWIAAYQNCQPWFGDNEFYYVSVSGNDGSPDEWVPYFRSFPVQLLWTDCDY